MLKLANNGDANQADIWLFPGLNGSGRFHQPFCAALSPQFSCIAWPLPADGPQDYNHLIDYFSHAFVQRDRPVTVIGESFSGPLVYELACRFPDKITRVIWAASFVDNPRPYLTQLPLPTTLIDLGRHLPAKLIYRFAFRGHDEKFWPVFLEERASFSADVWQARIKAVKKRRAPAAPLTQPALYLQASHDLLIRPNTLNAVRDIAPQLTVKSVKATHLLLQSNFQEAARVVRDWLNTTA